MSRMVLALSMEAIQIYEWAKTNGNSQKTIKLLLQVTTFEFLSTPVLLLCVINIVIFRT